LKVHVYGVDGVNGQVPPAWAPLFQAMEAAGIRGEVADRTTPGARDMASVYRAADLVATPHVIATRIVGEALSCGTAVLGARGNDFAQWACDPGDPADVADALVRAWESWKRLGGGPRGRGLDGLVAEAAAAFSPARFAASMGLVYEESLL
jgi:glycosyltransferase involved in cell wall biosynthesis